MILGTLALLYGRGVPSESKIATTYVEMKEIKGAFEEATVLNKIAYDIDSAVLYEEIRIPKAETSTYSSVLGTSSTGDYYYLDFTSSRKLENALDLENIKNDYLINIQNMEIYSIKGVGVKSGDVIEVKYEFNEIEKYYKNTFKK